MTCRVIYGLKVYAIAYHAQTDGLSSVRFNCTQLTCIMLAKTHEEDWDEQMNIYIAYSMEGMINYQLMT